MLTALSEVLKKVPKEIFHEIIKDEFTVEQQTEALRKRMSGEPRVLFSKLFEPARHKLEVVTIFLALLELIRQKVVVARQGEAFGEIVILRADSVALARAEGAV